MRTDERTDVTKVIVTFRNFANVHKNDPRNNDSYSCYRLEHAGKDLKSEPLLSQN
jgi:hypothetical protein